MSLADDLADLLTSGGLSSTVHVGELLPRPNAAVVVVQTLGEPTLRSFDGAVAERVRVQLLARSVGYPAAESLMSSAHGKLDGAKDRVLNGRRYYWIEAVQPPFYLGQDEEERSLFAANYTVVRSAST